MKKLVLALIIGAVAPGATQSAVRLSDLDVPLPTELAWQYGGEETLHYDSTVAGGFAVTGEYEYHAAVRFTPEKSCSVKAAIFYQYDASSENGRVYVYGANSRTRPGDRLALASYPGAGPQRWKRVDFSQPVPVDSGVDFWTCVTTTYYTGDHPLAVDRGPLVRYRGGYIKVPLMGETWYQLSSAPFYENRNWNQRAIVVSGTGIEEVLGPARPTGTPRQPTIARGSLFLARSSSSHHPSSLLDASGRKVIDLRPGHNDIRRISSGVYFLRSVVSSRRSAVTKVVILR